MRRRIFSIASQLLLLLCAATVVLWVCTRRYPMHMVPLGMFDNERVELRVDSTPLWGFEILHEKYSWGTPSAIYFVVIHVNAVETLVVISGLLALSVLRPNEVRSEVCQTCAYNLTGNTSGVCPECGSPMDGA